MPCCINHQEKQLCVTFFQLLLKISIFLLVKILPASKLTSLTIVKPVYHFDGNAQFMK